jgi:tRNA pseudouridine65 synthase
LGLEIIYRDDELVAINKPHGLPVHRSDYVRNAEVFAVQELRNQLGKYVYPCHRIDRKTSGVLLFALEKEMLGMIQQLFVSRQIRKSYLAIVRGYTDDTGIIESPLTNEKGKVQEASTEYRTLARTELDIPSGKFSTSRYSLVEAYPHTGRLHQIRKHFAHVFHPVIGDRPHGCNKQNKLFKERYGFTTMMLHASRLDFIHPGSNDEIVIRAEPHPEFRRMMSVMGWDKPTVRINPPS